MFQHNKFFGLNSCLEAGVAGGRLFFNGSAVGTGLWAHPWLGVPVLARHLSLLPRIAGFRGALAFPELAVVVAKAAVLLTAPVALVALTGPQQQMEFEVGATEYD